MTPGEVAVDARPREVYVTAIKPRPRRGEEIEAASMSGPIEQVQSASRDASGRRSGAALGLAALGVGLSLLVAAALVLWAGAGGEVFLTQAFAALVACF
ncbi:hypothetical protein [Hansschlegelia sp. KR7-227]|jgi:hypothetical protein|uniref:hypothetical protein n=1 Tax=Hansschlegelia sp. KR7-227 TaxID=3400914 RepID=UPI003C096FA7